MNAGSDNSVPFTSGVHGQGQMHRPMRKGKWSFEEEAYATRLIRDFKAGILSLNDGASLRAYLAEMLNCEPMRVTKKFARTDCIGKVTFRPASLQAFSPELRAIAAREAEGLRARFLQRDAQGLNWGTGIVAKNTFVPQQQQQQVTFVAPPPQQQHMYQQQPTKMMIPTCQQMPPSLPQQQWPQQQHRSQQQSQPQPQPQQNQPPLSQQPQAPAVAEPGGDMQQEASSILLSFIAKAHGASAPMWAQPFARLAAQQPNTAVMVPATATTTAAATTPSLAAENVGALQPVANAKEEANSPVPDEEAQKIGGHGALVARITAASVAPHVTEASAAMKRVISDDDAASCKRCRVAVDMAETSSSPTTSPQTLPEVNGDAPLATASSSDTS